MQRSAVGGAARPPQPSKGRAGGRAGGGRGPGRGRAGGAGSGFTSCQDWKQRKTHNKSRESTRRGAGPMGGGLGRVAPSPVPRGPGTGRPRGGARGPSPTGGGRERCSWVSPAPLGPPGRAGSPAGCGPTGSLLRTCCAAALARLRAAERQLALGEAGRLAPVWSAVPRTAPSVGPCQALCPRGLAPPLPAKSSLGEATAAISGAARTSRPAAPRPRGRRGVRGQPRGAAGARGRGQGSAWRRLEVWPPLGASARPPRCPTALGWATPGWGWMGTGVPQRSGGMIQPGTGWECRWQGGGRGRHQATWALAMGLVGGTRGTTGVGGGRLDVGWPQGVEGPG